MLSKIDRVIPLVNLCLKTGLYSTDFAILLAKYIGQVYQSS